MLRRLALLAVFVSFAGVVHAQQPCGAEGTTCDTAPFVQAYSSSGLSAIDFDTGFVPGGSPLQIRAELHVGGNTSVRLAATEGVYWPPPVRATFDGESGGYLIISYGLEIRVRVRFDILGIGWEGDIPIPFIPNDLLLSSVVPIDSLVLPGASTRPVVASDVTDRIRVLNYDLLSILSALGVGGGVALDVQGMLTASYASDLVRIDGVPSAVQSETSAAVVYPRSGSDYGASIDVDAHAEGRLTHVGAIHLFPAVYVKILGKTYNLDVADIPINLVNNTKNLSFSSVRNHVPLPDLGLDRLRVELGSTTVGESTRGSLVIRNEGTAPMDVEVVIDSTSFGLGQTGPFTLAPGASVDLEPSFFPIGAGTFEDDLILRTNDPDSPMKSVRLAATATLPLLDAGVVADAGEEPDAGLGEDGGAGSEPYVGVGGCGCNLASSATLPDHAWLAALVPVALLVRRRRAAAAAAA